VVLLCLRHMLYRISVVPHTTNVVNNNTNTLRSLAKRPDLICVSKACHCDQSRCRFIAVWLRKCDSVRLGLRFEIAYSKTPKPTPPATWQSGLRRILRSLPQTSSRSTRLLEFRSAYQLRLQREVLIVVHPGSMPLMTEHRPWLIEARWVTATR
jgi:hypothetical protein